MAQKQTQRRATDWVSREMLERHWSKQDLAEATGLDYATVSDMLTYKRTVQARSQARIEGALAWEPGTFRQLALGAIDEPFRIRDRDDWDEGSKLQASYHPSAISEYSDAELIAELARRLAVRGVDPVRIERGGEDIPASAASDDAIGEREEGARRQ